MKIAIVGWGLEGQSAFRYFGPDNQYLIVNEEPRDDFPPAGPTIEIRHIDAVRQPGVTGNVADLSYLEGLEAYDKVVYTPTSRKNLETIYPADSTFWQKATTNQHIFFEEVKSKNIIGVTGTKGKGTTSTLTAKMLEAGGLKTHLGGNIGRPVLDFVREVQPGDWVVLELSNFQLYKFPYSPHVAVILMIASEHMDWHPHLDDYTDAKANITRHQNPDDVAIYLDGDTNSEKIAGLSPGTKIPYFAEPGSYVREDGMLVAPSGQEVIKTRDLKLIGRHNWQNACAAITAAWQASQDVDAIRKVLSTFSGLEHRLEFVRELDHIQYFDDSFGTTPDTAAVAVQAFVQPIVLILGGSDKGASYEDLVTVITQKDRVRHVIAIGQTGPKIAELLRAQGFDAITEGLTSMADIVAEARRRAQPGDVVLLSTASASFGLFRDYKDRGNQFKSVVNSLA